VVFVDLQVLKVNYNKKLKRYYAAMEYFKTASDADIDKNFPIFRGVCGELYSIQKQIEQFTGEKMSKDEIKSGFIDK
jgi:hypothetical protein